MSQHAQQVLASRRHRSLVAPAANAPLLFAIRGDIVVEEWDGPRREDKSGTFELRVMNTAGDLQPAANFREFMRVVLTDVVEVYKLLDSEGRDEDGFGVPETFRQKWREFREDVMPSFLRALGVPWPLRGLLEGADGWVLRRLIARTARPRFDAFWLKLVVSKLPKLAGVPFLFDEFAPPAPGVIVETNKDLYRVLVDIEQGDHDFLRRGPGHVYYEYDTILSKKGNARGRLTYFAYAYADCLTWTVKRG
mmetsp:Transcript_17123/g.51103  ORF Transcript_17123/g.51103 Transcript_17123/m.51103 type:complete len:250 (+) Transcript_17123:204-953(+)